MAKETEPILRAALLATKTSESLKEAELKIKAMCSKEDIDSVEAAIAEIIKIEK